MDKNATKEIENCPRYDDPCDNSMHWVGKMVYDEKNRNCGINL